VEVALVKAYFLHEQKVVAARVDIDRLFLEKLRVVERVLKLQ
jgi:hypothetical protein